MTLLEISLVIRIQTYFDNSEETKKFVDDLNAISRPYIASYENRDKMNTLLTDLWNYPKIGVPSKKGGKEKGKYYFFKNSGLQNQSVMYVQVG